ncbi:MAG: hypothetical protein WD533_00565 [Dehalococcoidia bacterium]
MATAKADLTRFTLDLDRALQRRLKVAAALQGISMREYVTRALTKVLEEESVDHAEKARRAVDNLADLSKLRDEIFRGKVLTDSVDIIHEMREERARQLEQR